MEIIIGVLIGFVLGWIVSWVWGKIFILEIRKKGE